jgi:hypothetical protein
MAKLLRLFSGIEDVVNQAGHEAASQWADPVHAVV